MAESTVLERVDEYYGKLLPDNWYVKKDWRDFVRLVGEEFGEPEEIEKEIASNLNDVFRDIKFAQGDLAVESFVTPEDVERVAKLVSTRRTDVTPEDVVGLILDYFAPDLAIQKEGYIRRKRVKGKTMWCVYSHQTGRCFGCFVEGTDVVMSDGTLKPIETIEVGERVFTHKGRVKEVVALSKRWYEGPVVKLKFWGRRNGITCTPEHPFLLRYFDGECACGCGSKLSYSSIREGHRFKSGHNSRSDVNPSSLPLEKYEKVEWIEVSELLNFDPSDLQGVWGLQPRIESSVSPPEITPGKAKLLGYFLAEGSYDKYSQTGERYGVSFALSASESDTIDEIARLLTEEFGAPAFVTNNTGHSVAVRTRIGRNKTRAKQMVDFFWRYAGEYAYHKRLPEEVLYWSTDLLRPLVEAWFRGSGSCKSLSLIHI